MDYGNPAEAMGLKYIQYEIGVAKSTLQDRCHRHDLLPQASHAARSSRVLSGVRGLRSRHNGEGDSHGEDSHPHMRAPYD